MRYICLFLYYYFAKFLPRSTRPLGKLSKAIRGGLCKKIFLHCGDNINIERGAEFGSGRNITIGTNSGIGVNCVISGDVNIGDNVMMGPNCVIVSRNHAFNRTDIPMVEQGYTKSKTIMISDDVWLGVNVIILSGVVIGKGAVIGAGAVVTQDVEALTIVGGNPAKKIGFRGN